VNLFFLGIIGEYVGRIYEEAKGRPHYVVRKLIASGGTDSSQEDGHGFADKTKAQSAGQ
jgi:polyisoprenyl-phosphate glycosyltransferase